MQRRVGNPNSRNPDDDQLLMQFTDENGHTITLPAFPTISLNPRRYRSYLDSTRSGLGPPPPPTPTPLQSTLMVHDEDGDEAYLAIMNQVLEVSFQEYWAIGGSTTDSNNEIHEDYKTRKKSITKLCDEKFETFFYGKKSAAEHQCESDTMCVICQYGFKSGQKVRRTCEKCFFHKKCIDKWIFTYHDSCPTCVRKLF